MKKVDLIQINGLVSVAMGGIGVIVKDDPTSDRIEVQVWNLKQNLMLSSEIYYDPHLEPLDPLP
jgi:hypothetical protein